MNDRDGDERSPGKEVNISARHSPDAPHGAMPIISIRAGRDPDVHRTQNRDGGKTPKKNLVSQQPRQTLTPCHMIAGIPHRPGAWKLPDESTC